MKIINPLDMKFVPKRWGYESWIVNNDQYCGKILFIKQGRYTSFHWHEKKDEVLYIQKGKMWMTYQSPDDSYPLWTELGVGSAFHVDPFLKHQMEAIEDTLIFEVSTQHFDEDSFRDTKELVIDHSTEGFLDK